MMWLKATAVYLVCLICLLLLIFYLFCSVLPHAINGNKVLHDDKALKSRIQFVTLLLEWYIMHLSLVVRKPVFGVSDLVQHKPGCTATEDG